MNRCLPSHPFARARLPLLLWAGLACAAAATAAAPLAASAQQLQPYIPPSVGVARNFPEAAKRGTLLVTSTAEAQLDGQPIRMAPGMRLFSPQNSLVFLHTVIGQRMRVNYLTEASTGMLLTAWILSEGEAAQPLRGDADTLERNFRFGPEPDSNAPALR